MGSCELQPSKQHNLTLNSCEVNFVLEENRRSSIQSDSLSIGTRQQNQYNKQNQTYNSVIQNSSAKKSNPDSAFSFTPKFKSLIVKQQMLSFNWNTTLPNSSKYQIRGKHARLLSKNQHPYQLVSDSPLPSQGVYELNLKIKKYGKDTCISFGIMSQQNQQKQCSCSCPQTITYMSYPDGKGAIVKQGRNVIMKKQDQFFIGIEEQGQVKFVIDMDVMQITIERRLNKLQPGSKTTKIYFQDCFSNKQLYFFACMSSYCDTVQIV